MKTSNLQVESRRNRWRQILAQQKQSGQSVHAFCVEQGLRQPSFYEWRRRLRRSEPVRFALVETAATGRASAACLELHLASGERLQIGAGVEAATLRAVLAVLRERA